MLHARCVCACGQIFPRPALDAALERRRCEREEATRHAKEAMALHGRRSCSPDSEHPRLRCVCGRVVVLWRQAGTAGPAPGRVLPDEPAGCEQLCLEWRGFGSGRPACRQWGPACSVAGEAAPACGSHKRAPAAGHGVSHDTSVTRASVAHGMGLCVHGTARFAALEPFVLGWLRRLPWPHPTPSNLLSRFPFPSCGPCAASDADDDGMRAHAQHGSGEQSRRRTTWHV
jgi:hypothetical protein